MGDCGQTGAAECPDKESSSENEAVWIGIGLGLALLLICTVWVVRACSNKVRRRRMVDKMCCLSKDEAVETPPEYTSNGEAPHGVDNVTYYRPPPAYDDIVKNETEDLGRSSPAARASAQPKNGTPSSSLGTAAACSCENESHPRPRVPLRKSRSTVSMMTISLATIEEDANEARPSLSDILSVIRPKAKNPAPPRRSKSHPDRLDSLVLHFDTEHNRDCGKDVSNEDRQSSNTLFPPCTEGRPRSKSYVDPSAGGIHIRF